MATTLPPPDGREQLRIQTKRLPAHLQAYVKRPGAQEADAVIKGASIRKHLLVSKLRNSDYVRSDWMFTDDVRQQLNERSSGCIEQQATINGEYALQHGDDFAGLRNLDLHLLQANGLTYVLHFLRPPSMSLVPGDRIEMQRALLLDREIIVSDDSQLVVLPRVLGEEADEPSLEAKPRRVFRPTPDRSLIIKVNFTNDRSTITTPETPEAIVASLNTAINQNALGSLAHETLIRGWYQLDLGRTCGGEDISIDPITTAAVAAADPDVQFTEVKRIVVIAPFATSGGAPCSWEGLYGGRRTFQTADGSVSLNVAWVRSDHVQPVVVGHEIGHSWVNHAAFKPCAIGDACTPVDTINNSDPYDIMGGQTMGHFNGLHKEAAAWLESSSLLTISGQVGAVLTYTLAPIESTSTQLKVLKIPRGSGQFLYIEFRQPINGDGQLNPNAFSGPLIHISRESPFGGFYDSVLIDPSVDSSNPASSMSSALLPGQDLIDPRTNTNIRAISVSPTAASIEVTLGMDL